MTVVVDASVAIKWLLEEEGSEAARRLAADEVMVAPELMLIECANVLRTKTRFGQLDEALSRQALLALEAMPMRWAPIRPYVAAAHAIAIELNRSAYDALYLALALSERAVLVTAHQRFASAALAHPAYDRSVRLLG
jgi:predicted nucleic acid-binding protein